MTYRLMLGAALVAASSAMAGCIVSDDETRQPASSATIGSGGQASSSGSQGGGGGGGGATGGGGNGEGGTVVVEGTGKDLCPGDAYTLVVGQELVLNGDTTNAADDYETFCGDTTPTDDGNDLVYAITLPKAGTFTMELEHDPAFQPSLSYRTTCDDDATTQLCFDVVNETNVVKLDAAAGTYFIFIDAFSGTKGPFSLHLSLDDAKCGDAIINAAEEQCDPYPVAPNDGCTDPGAPGGGCKLEPADPAKDKCPGEAYMVTAAGLKLLATDGHTTLNYTNDYDGTCSKAMGGKDRVYQLTPTVSGTMTVSVGYEPDGATDTCKVDLNLEGCFDSVLYARTTCGDIATELDCSDVGAANGEVISFPVTANTPYFVFVDGFVAIPKGDGTYNLLVSLQ